MGPLEGALDTLPDGFVVFDREWRIIYVNREAERMAGKTRQELLGHCPWEIYPDARGGALDLNYRRAVAEQVAVEFETPDPSGRVWYSVRASPSPGGFSVHVRDVTAEKAAGKELRRSEARFAATFEQAAVGIAHVALDGRWLRVNQKLCDIVGYTREELLERTFQDITHPDDLQDLNYLRQLYDGQIQTHSTQKRYFRKDGTLIWIQLTSSLATPSPGETPYFIAIIDEITERKLTERRLRESEEKLRIAQQAAGAGAWDWDLLTGTVTWSEEWCRLSGLDPATPASYERWLASVHEEDRAYCERTVRQSLERRSGLRMEYRTIHPRHGLRWLAVRGRSFYDAQGRPVRMCGITLDVTARKRVEALKAGQNRVLELLATGKGLGEVLTAHVTTIERHCRGVSGSVLLLDDDGRHLRRGAAPNLPPAYLRAIDGIEIGPAAGSCGTAAHLGRPVEVVDVQSDPRWAGYRELAARHGLRACWSRPIFAADGRVLGTFALYPDECRAPDEAEARLMVSAAHLAGVAIEQHRTVAALGAAKEAAEAANEAKDHFLATVSHELRTPISAILIWATLLKGDGVDEERRAEAVEMILECARAQSRLVGDLLDASRILYGKLHAEIRPVSLPRTVRTAVETMRPGAQAKGVDLALSLADAIVPGDAPLLQRIVSNLVSNAIKFTPSGGHVRVAVRRADAEAQLEVSDDGEGIEPAFLPRLFERFEQADTSTTRRHGGLGLGLSIVRHLVELHGGSVRAYSAGCGSGATFTVTLPLAAAEIRDPQARPPAPGGGEPAAPLPALGGVRVLVVEDDARTRESLSTLLQTCGAQVSAAASVGQGLARLPKCRPHVVVSDIGMPHEDGYDLITRLRRLPDAQGGRTPAIALTARAAGDDRDRALASGFDIYLAKPVAPADLIEAVASLAAGEGARLAR